MKQKPSVRIQFIKQKKLFVLQVFRVLSTGREAAEARGAPLGLSPRISACVSQACGRHRKPRPTPTGHGEERAGGTDLGARGPPRTGKQGRPKKLLWWAATAPRHKSPSSPPALPPPCPQSAHTPHHP